MRGKAINHTRPEIAKKKLTHKQWWFSWYCVCAFMHAPLHTITTNSISHHPHVVMVIHAAQQKNQTKPMHSKNDSLKASFYMFISIKIKFHLFSLHSSWLCFGSSDFLSLLSPYHYHSFCYWIFYVKFYIKFSSLFNFSITKTF